MRILVINRLEDPACAEAMKMIPGAEVRVVNEANYDACAEAFSEFDPHAVIVWGRSTSGYSPGVTFDKRTGHTVWLPPPIMLGEVNFCLFRTHFAYRLEILSPVTDLGELAVRVVEKCKPEVSVLITDSDEFWQKALEKDFREIPGVMVFAQSAHVGDAVRELVPDIVVMGWMGTRFSNLIRQNAKDQLYLRIAVFSSVPERDIILRRPDVDFVLCKSAPIAALTLVVKEWTEQIQARKRSELREGLLRNQLEASLSS